MTTAHNPERPEYNREKARILQWVKQTDSSKISNNLILKTTLTICVKVNEKPDFE